MVAERHGAFVVYVHSGESPTDEEWNLVLQFYRVIDERGLRVLIHTEGGAPSAAQRARLRELLAGREPLIAMLTPSILARAAGTAIAWFNRNVRVFGPRELDSALDHLRAPAEERAALAALLHKLKAELAINPLV